MVPVRDASAVRKTLKFTRQRWPNIASGVLVLWGSAGLCPLATSPILGHRIRHPPLRGHNVDVIMERQQHLSRLNLWNEPRLRALCCVFAKKKSMRSPCSPPSPWRIECTLHCPPTYKKGKLRVTCAAEPRRNVPPRNVVESAQPVNGSVPARSRNKFATIPRTPPSGFCNSNCFTTQLEERIKKKDCRD